MPQPRTPRCMRRGSHSLATWQPTYENTGQQGRNAGCPGPRTRNEPSNFAPPTYKNTRTTDQERGKDRHTASFKTATRRSRPLKPAPEQPRPKPRPRPGGADTLARRANWPKPEPKAAPVPPPPDPQPKPNAQTCPFFKVAESAAMHPEWPDGAEVQGVFGGILRGQPKQFVWFRGKKQGRQATPVQHEERMAGTPGVGRKSGDLKPRTLGRPAVPGVPGADPHTRQPGTAGHRLHS